ncbi:MAG: hypothetical protein M3Y03_00570 [Verrucomicrobiota bacterium]|nr:hypothetical protein [Verrucomicrobiota bacterium]
MILHSFFVCFLLCATALCLPAGELATGSIHALTFQDVDGGAISTTDGHVTIITVVTRQNEAKARQVADLVPDRYVGDPKYRYVTLVNFQRKLAGPFQGLTRAIIRNRLDAEAKTLGPDYATKHLSRDPRKDLHVIADFDGSAVARLGLPAASNQVAVFLFGPKGKLLARWNDVPPGDSLPKAIAASG